MSRWGCLPKPMDGATIVLVDDAEGAEAHLRGVVVVRKAEAEVRVEPAVVCVASFCCFSDNQHVSFYLSFIRWRGVEKDSGVVPPSPRLFCANYSKYVT